MTDVRKRRRGKLGKKNIWFRQTGKMTATTFREARK